MPNLPGPVVTFAVDDKDKLSVLSQLRQSAEWNKSATTVSLTPTTTKQPVVRPVVQRVTSPTATTAVTPTTATTVVKPTPEPENKRLLARSRI